MLALELTELSIIVDTVQRKRFSINIPFRKGLNVVRADNTSGKSTCVNAIAYALGLESILGPLKNKPFPTSLYETILNNKIEKKPYYVTYSSVELTIKNSLNETAKLKRLIKNDNKIITVFENNEYQDYFLKTSGTLGSSKSEFGFHNWLEIFMGWELPFVPNLNGEKTKLYLETIYPLFFIEQKRGWSEIQANVPVNYGIKNVKKTALEYILNISNFERENQINTLRKNIDNIEEQWKFIENNIEILSQNSNITYQSLSKIGNQSFPIEFYFSRSDANISLHVAKVELVRELNKILISDDNELNEIIENQKDTINQLLNDLKDLEFNKNQLQIIAADSSKKSNILFNDLEKYKQLDLLTKLGSEHNINIDLENCPICLNKLSDNLHTTHNPSKINPMTLEENILFLKEQVDFMKNMKINFLNKLTRIEGQIKNKKNILSQEEKKLSILEDDYSNIFGDVLSQLRRKVEIECSINEINAFIDKIEKLENSLIKLQVSWQINFQSLSLLKENSIDSRSADVINKLETIMQKNLDLFGFNESSVHKITISKNTLRPEQDGYDIIAETSASDYIRVIWAYTLALLELANNSESPLRHAGFVVFDEPRQHEAKTQSLFDLILHTSEIFQNSGQAIFTTSYENLKDLEENIDNVNIIYFDDYILQ